MTMNLEDRLRLDMERATKDLRVPSGLALAAYRRRRKRQTTLRVATATVTATALIGAVAVAGVISGRPGPAVSPRTARLTDYVIGHVQRALAPAAIDTMVGSVRETYPPGTTVEPVPGGLSEQVGGTSTASQWSVGYSVVWAYQTTTKFAAYTSSGQPVFAAELTHPRARGTETAIIYASQTWWTAPVHLSSPRPAGCLQGGGIYLRPGPGGGWPGFIRSQLACGAYTVAGRQVVDGIDAIKLTGSAAGSITLWVDPATYRPVRVTDGPEHWSFQWLPATPASLAQLKVAVPAGFQQVKPPALPSH